MSYVNNMSYVKLFELRHESCKLYEYFYKLLNPNVSVCVCLGGVILPSSCWFSLNNSEMMKALTLAFWSIH